MIRSDGDQPDLGTIDDTAARQAGKAKIRSFLQRLADRRDAAAKYTTSAEVLEKFGTEVAAATILVGTALAGREGLEDRIRHSAPVLIVEVPHDDWVMPTARSLAVIFGTAYDRDDPERNFVPEAQSGAIIIAPGRKGRHNDHDSSSRAARAIREYRPLIGVTGHAFPALPDDLLRASEERVLLEGLDADAVEMLIEHVVGAKPNGRLNEDAAVAIEPADLRLAIHRARGAEGALDRLQALIDKRMRKIKPAVAARLEDVAGYGSARDWGLAVAADLSAYSRHELQWSEVDPAALLYGIPGTGKTSFAGLLARQAGVPLFTGSLAQWQSVGEAHLGTTLKSMRAFFEAAAKAAPCVVLIDEVDSFGSRSSFGSYNRDYSTQVVNGFLECLDGASGREGVLLIGTTNNRDRIDPAILRSGRFDRCIEIPLPSVSDLAAILRHHLGSDLDKVDLTDAARRATGATGADCAAWVRRARSTARRANRLLALADLLREIGAARVVPNRDDDRRAAVHESGHALVAYVLGFELSSITLLQSGEMEATTRVCQRTMYPTRDDLRDLLAVYLAGRAAEMHAGIGPSAAAGRDLAEATELCSRMHCSWGLEGRIAVRPLAPLPARVAAAVERDLQQASARASSILQKHRVAFDRLAQALVMSRALEGGELPAIIGVLESAEV